MPEETQDPSVQTDNTPEANPAPKKKVTKKRASKKAAKEVVFRSRDVEPREFAILNIRAVRNAQHPGRCEWHVPAGDVERFSRHPHVQSGRAKKV